MHRSKSSCLGSSFLFLLGACFLFSVIIFFLGWAIPIQAEKDFGTPASNLSLINRFKYSALLVWRGNDLTSPVDSLGKEISFEIGMGESIPSITTRLWQAGLISNPSIFRTYLIYKGLDRTIQAGKYSFSTSMTAQEIAHALQDATPRQATITIFPGWRIEEVAAALPTTGLDISPEIFLASARARFPGYSISNLLSSDDSLEGFLFPDTYELDRQASASDLLQATLENFEKHVTAEMREGFDRQGLALLQAVTLASIVEREAQTADEMPMIASVYLNRLTNGMKLDADPTVQYALGYNKKQDTWWKNPLSRKDLNVNSPYNTYQYTGLPPGPISNPGLDALRAVAFPAETPYFYFRATCDGSGRHLFAKSYEEHLNNACD